MNATTSDILITVDDRGRTNLSKLGGRSSTYLVETLDDGTLVLHPAVVNPINS